MKLIALTGGIASGKSTIARRLTEHGAVHIDADQLTREVMAPGAPALDEIREHFGGDVFDADGSLDRAALGARVFSDARALAQLNAIVHPATRALARERIADAVAADPDAVIVYDVPLLVEANVQMPWDLIVVSEAPEHVRIHRMVDLRGMSREEAERRISHQAGDDERRAIADLVIDTGGTEAHTLAQADALWERLTR